jgi:cephalosporin hydroxylase
MIEVLQVETELTQLLTLYADVAPKAVLEIGTYQGGTLKEWLTVSTPKRVVAVDTDHVNPDEYEAWRSEETQLYVIEGDSTDDHVRSRITEFSPYDWVFIDGDHGHAGVTADTSLALMVLESGYLVYHDIIGDMNCPVYAPGLIVDGFEAQGYEVTRFVEGGIGEAAHGIGVVKIP